VRLVVTHPKYGGTTAQANTQVEETKVVLATPGSVECVVTEDGRTPPPGKWMVAVVRSGGGMRAPMEMPRLVTPGLDGRFVVEALQPGSYTFQSVESMRALRSPGGFYSAAGMMFMFGEKGSVRCEVVAGRRESLRLEVNPAAQPIEGPSGTLTGTVTIDGRPAVGYFVMSFMQRRRSVITDANGRFDCGPVPVGTWELQLVAPNAVEGRSPLWSGRVEVKVGEAKTVAIELEMGSLAGVVIGPDGGPVAGVVVNLNGQPKLVDGFPAGNRASFHAMSDANGRFAVDALPVGTYTLSAQSRGVGKTTMRDVKIEVGSRANVDVRLVRGFTLQGRVDLQAFGARKFRFGSIAILDEANQENEWARLQPDGSFEVQNLKGGTYKLMPSLVFEERGERGSWSVAESPITIHADRLDVVLRPVFTPAAPTGTNERMRNR
jgi:hypothetical protein